MVYNLEVYHGGEVLPEEKEFKSRKQLYAFLKAHRLPRKDQLIIITGRDRMSYQLICR